MDSWVLDHKKRHHRFFEEMTRIPHGSFHEKEYGDYLVRFAKERSFEYKRDAIGNVMIHKPPFPGYEDHPCLGLQAHMDMVWAKTENISHDFLKDPLKLYIDHGFLKARGTTLGADDGTGVAYILAVLDDPELKAPPIEAVFTVQEETGLGGALALKKEDIRFRRLISLDCGGGDSIYISSLAGLKGIAKRQFQWEKAQGQGYCVRISGLKGGYSDGYKREQANANKLGARLVYELGRALAVHRPEESPAHHGGESPAHHEENSSLPSGEVCCACGEKARLLSCPSHWAGHGKSGLALRLTDVKGGGSDNKIATWCELSFTCAEDPAVLRECAKRLWADIKKEISQPEKDVMIEWREITPSMQMSQRCSDGILSFMYLFPCGLRHRNTEFSDIISESVNWSAVECRGNEICLTYHLRGSSDSRIAHMQEEILLLSSCMGFECREEGSFPAWEFHDSHLLRTLQRVFKENRGKELGLIPVQGGLECGVFARMYPEMDIIAMGPYGYDVHTPDERLDLKSFDDIYEVFCRLLEAL